MIINSQEVFLLNRYISLEYFSEMREVWEEMVLHVDAGLTRFIQASPSDYKKRRLPEKPDVVWGHHVLPNFRRTLQTLNDGVILLSHGDYKGLSCAHGPLNDFKGQMHFWSGWLDDLDEIRYRELLHKAVLMASNVTATDHASWSPGDLSADYREESRGPLMPPKSWPAYQRNSDIVVASGAKVSISGIYVPDIENSCTEFLNANRKMAPLARVFVRIKDLFAPDTGLKYGEQAEFAKKPCTWKILEVT